MNRDKSVQPAAEKAWNSGLRERVFASPAYQFLIAPRNPPAPRFAPPDLWPGDPRTGMAILKDELFDAGRRIDFSDDGTPDGPPNAWQIHLHDHSWLRDLRAFGADQTPARARDLLGDWLNRHSHWGPVTWRADILAGRVTAWLCHFRFISDGAEPEFAARFLAALTAQARHLRHAAPDQPLSVAVLRVLKARLYCDLCLRGFEKKYAGDLKAFEREIGRQILPDGGHVERNPTSLARALEDLLDLRATLLAARQEVPETLQSAIDRAVPFLRALRHGDGTLALFNGSGAGDRAAIDSLLAQAKARGKPLSSAPHSGFHRLAAGRTVVIIDAGSPPPAGADRAAHAGVLSFEMSIGKERLIVNCGVHPDEDSEWNPALRATAAHSTVTVGDTNSAELNLGGRHRPPPVTVETTRREADGNLLLEASHDGYQKPFRLIHRRSIYVSADGTDVRGEDELSGSLGYRYAVRFHLHPRAHASLLAAGAGVLIKLPSGNGWRFQAKGGEISLEESVYLGDGVPRRTEQIVVRGGMEEDPTVTKWRLSRTG